MQDTASNPQSELIFVRYKEPEHTQSIETIFHEKGLATIRQRILSSSSQGSRGADVTLQADGNAPSNTSFLPLLSKKPGLTAADAQPTKVLNRAATKPIREDMVDFLKAPLSREQLENAFTLSSGTLL
eukprot:TRINITY_DN12724_c0_g1_i1.p2 TRINITY_DN12724_c0_g1~~TRINITY_DN12724_c0_g1_i1.p2  ORF type:complete len:128 (+),score=25.41 TRINITY_DN12724_c0_g1_i1:43-426(+)